MTASSPWDSKPPGLARNAVDSRLQQTFQIRRFTTMACSALLFFTLSPAMVAGGDERPPESGWIQLFNGRDLSGWIVTLGRSADRTETRDPFKVFGVVMEDGEPALKVSGEGLGGITTLAEYGDYHLELEFKWGEKRFDPRANEPRDSGLLYHGSHHSNPDTGWVESLELGILEGGETGDFWSVPGAHGARIVVDVEGEDIPVAQRRYHDQPIRYRRGGVLRTGFSQGILCSADYEKPRGQWNKVELYCLGQTAVHRINGRVNMVLTGARRVVNGREEPVTRGRIQLQCEGAETFFRRLRLKPITQLPELPDAPR